MNNDFSLTNECATPGDDRASQSLKNQSSVSCCLQEYFSISQTAQITGLSEKTIRRATMTGELPASNVGGKLRALYRISRPDITAWMARKRYEFGPTKSEQKKAVSEFFGKPMQSRKRRRTSSS